MDCVIMANEQLAKVEKEEVDDDIEMIPMAEEKTKVTSTDSPYRGRLLAANGNGEIDSVMNANPNANSATYIPAALHEFYRQASALNSKGDFTCALCSRILKCRSARDMRDHALSHGGPHWASAFRCLLCSYHSHSRRSVSKHITSAHLIPDGVQCLPGELMENETITRADELVALVRDCFPLSSLDPTRSRTKHRQPTVAGIVSCRGNRNRPDEGIDPFGSMSIALPVETSEPSGPAGSMTKSSISGLFDGQTPETNMKTTSMGFLAEEGEYDEGETWTNGVRNENENECDEQSPAEAPGVMEGWTVVEDGGDSNLSPDYCDGSAEDANGQSSNMYSHYQAASAPSQSNPTIHAPLLHGLLRDFQFHPNMFASEAARPPAVSTSMYSSTSNFGESTDDPRQLIERLLNVVAPDVARFLLEEAIRARAIEAANTRNMLTAARGAVSAPTIETVGSILPVVSQVATQAPPVTKRINVKPKIVLPTTATQLKSRQRLGKLGVFKCSECSSLFKRRRYLERHVRARHRLHCYRCTMTGCTFTHARELWYVRRHHAKHHGNETDLICRFCSKRFANSDDLTSRHHTCCSLNPRKSDPTTASSNE